jgi:hypothetical protein
MSSQTECLKVENDILLWTEVVPFMATANWLGSSLSSILICLDLKKYLSVVGTTML